MKVLSLYNALILHSLLAGTQFEHITENTASYCLRVWRWRRASRNCSHRHRSPDYSSKNYRNRKTKFINWNPISLPGFTQQADLHLTHIFKENNTFPILCVMIQSLRYKPTNARTSADLQQYFNTSTLTYFGPHRPEIRSSNINYYRNFKKVCAFVGLQCRISKKSRISATSETSAILLNAIIWSKLAFQVADNAGTDGQT